MSPHGLPVPLGGWLHEEVSGLSPNQPSGRSWVAVAAGSAVAAVILLVVILSSGSDMAPLDPDPGTTLASFPTTEPDREPEGLSLEFLNWMFPIEPDDYGDAAEVILWPFDPVGNVAVCLRSFGFRGYVDALATDSLPRFSEGMSVFWMPRPAVRRDADSVAADYPARVLLTLAVPATENVGRDYWIGELQGAVETRPWLGVAVSEAEAFYDAAIECQRDGHVGVDYPAEFQAAWALQDRWLFELREVDKHPNVVNALEGVLGCLVADRSGFFEGLDDPEHAVGRFDAFASVSLEDEEAREELSLIHI